MSKSINNQILSDIIQEFVNLTRETRRADISLIYFAPSPAKEQEGRGEALFHPVVYFDFMMDDGMCILVYSLCCYLFDMECEDDNIALLLGFLL